MDYLNRGHILANVSAIISSLTSCLAKLTGELDYSAIDPSPDRRPGSGRADEQTSIQTSRAPLLWGIPPLTRKEVEEFRFQASEARRGPAQDDVQLSFFSMRITTIAAPIRFANVGN
jgi:hypothetical protein